MTLLASNENREYAMYNFIYPLLANDNFSILSSTTSNKPHKGNRKKEAHGPHCSPEKTAQINKHI